MPRKQQNADIAAKTNRGHANARKRIGACRRKRYLTSRGASMQEDSFHTAKKKKRTCKNITNQYELIRTKSTKTLNERFPENQWKSNYAYIDDTNTSKAESRHTLSNNRLHLNDYCFDLLKSKLLFRHVYQNTQAYLPSGLAVPALNGP